MHYWLREGKANNAEVDYVIVHGESIYPIEVKAGKSGSLKSLHQYLLQKESKIAFRFDMNPASKQLKSASIRLSGTQKKTERLDYEIICTTSLFSRSTPAVVQRIGNRLISN